MQAHSLLQQAIVSLRNEGVKAVWYYIKGNIRWWLHKEAINDFLEKSHRCKDCYESGQCLHHIVEDSACGCPFGPVSLSGRLCNHKDEEDGE